MTFFENGQAEREERRDVAMARFTALKEMNTHLREKCHRLREKYAAAVDAYNELADEAKDRSDSSSSSDSSDDDDCCIM